MDEARNVLDLWVILSWVDRLDWAGSGLHLAHGAEGRGLDSGASESWGRGDGGDAGRAEAGDGWEGGAEGAVDGRHFLCASSREK